MQQIEEIDELQQRLVAAQELNAQLEQALSSRVVIEQAKGVLAERLGMSVEEAFDVLRYAARSSRIKLHDLADRVVHDQRTPNPVIIALARRSRWRAALMSERNEAMREVLQKLAASVQAQIDRLNELTSR